VDPPPAPTPGAALTLQVKVVATAAGADMLCLCARYNGAAWKKMLARRVPVLLDEDEWRGYCDIRPLPIALSPSAPPCRALHDTRR
jgi:hypothetical protein